MLKTRGLKLKDLLWHQVVLRILPASLDPQGKWDRWVEEQRKAYNQAQAARADTAIKKGKNLKKKSILTSTYPSNLAAEKEITTYPSNLAAEIENLTHLTFSLSEFHHALCLRRPEVSRFLKETLEDHKRNPEVAISAPNFHTARAPAAGCLKCGPNADHRTDTCQKIGSMAPRDWRKLAGDHCMRCGLHLHVVGQRCTYQCKKCGETHMTIRHKFFQQKPTKRDGPQMPAGQAKRPRREGPPAPPGAYHTSAYPPPPPQHYGPPPPTSHAPPSHYGAQGPSYHYAPSREAPPPPPAGPSHQGPPPPAGVDPDSWYKGRQAEKAAQKKRAGKKRTKKAAEIKKE
jgi:predicted RNA-binding Zn-ribbon protein involved in translation (DUF1610 family)